MRERRAAARQSRVDADMDAADAEDTVVSLGGALDSTNVVDLEDLSFNQVCCEFDIKQF